MKFSVIICILTYYCVCQTLSSPTRSPTVCTTSTPSKMPTTVTSADPSLQPSGQPTTQPSSSPTNPTSQPTSQPSPQPSLQPSRQPTTQPSSSPTNPTSQPSSQPSLQPSLQPSGQPTTQPSSSPTNPTSQPSSQPSRQPMRQPTSQPSRQPTSQPTKQPFAKPTGQPTSQPSRQPSTQPSSQPTYSPTSPSSQPSCAPSGQPSSQPTSAPSNPTSQPTGQPTRNPFARPTGQPSRQPTSQPSRQPFARPTGQPSRQPTSQPSCQPSRQPTSQPSRQPFARPTGQPSRQPTSQPSRQPFARPTSQPSTQPTSHPSCQPSRQPTSQPTCPPSRQPTSQPSRQPFARPTSAPSRQPTSQPSSLPTIQPSARPTSVPSRQPTTRPSSQPVAPPTCEPSSQPFSRPTGQPSMQPSGKPSIQPSLRPSAFPTTQPSEQPTSSPSNQPINFPTRLPSSKPSSVPSMFPSTQPTSYPSCSPTLSPTCYPSDQPSSSPSNQPSSSPIAQPSAFPSSIPSGQPSWQPSNTPTGRPSRQPTSSPSLCQSSRPTSTLSSNPSMNPSSKGYPTSIPSSTPSIQPSNHPSVQPTIQPSTQPSIQPSLQPSCQPTRQPTSHPSTLSVVALSLVLLSATQRSNSNAGWMYKAPQIDFLFSQDTNEFGGPGKFPCNRLLTWEMQRSKEGAVSLITSECKAHQRRLLSSCRWVSSRLLKGTVDLSWFTSFPCWPTTTLIHEENAIWDVRLRNVSGLAARDAGVVVSFNRTSSFQLRSGYLSWSSSLLQLELQLMLNTSRPLLMMDLSKDENVREGMWDRLTVSVGLVDESGRGMFADDSILQQAMREIAGELENGMERNPSNLVSMGSMWNVQSLLWMNGRQLNDVWIQVNASVCQSSRCKGGSSKALISRTVNISELTTVTVACDRSLVLSMPGHRTNSLESVVVTRSMELRAFVSVSLLRWNLFYTDRCDSMGKIGNVTWQLVEISTGVSRSLRSLSMDPLVLRVNASILSAGTSYSLQATMYHAGEGQLYSSNKVQIDCAASSLEALLLPSQREVMLSLTDRLLLDASNSRDSDIPVNEVASHLRFRWECRSYVNSVENGQSVKMYIPCQLNGTLTQDGSRLQWGVEGDTSWSRVWIRSSVTQQLETSMLADSEVSVMVLDSSQPIRSSGVATRIIKLVSGLAPLVLIRSTTSQLRNVNVGKLSISYAIRAVIQASQQSLSSSSVWCGWKWLTAPVPMFVTMSGEQASSGEQLYMISSLQSLTLDNVTTYQATSAPNQNRSVNLLLNTMSSLVSGGHYVFRLGTSMSTGQSLWADIELSTNQGPYGGWLRTLPSSGQSLVSQYSSTCGGWLDDDGEDNYPLIYEFRFWRRGLAGSLSASQSSGSWVVMPHYQHQQFVENTWLPQGWVNSSYQVQLRCTVQDNYGAVGTDVAVASVQVLPAGGSWSSRKLIETVQNVSTWKSSTEVQQTATVLSTMIRSGDIRLAPSERVEVSEVMVRAVNASLTRTDENYLDTGWIVLLLVQQQLREAKLSVVQSEAQNTLSKLTLPPAVTPGNSSNAGSSGTMVAVQEVTSQTGSAVGLLSQSLLQQSASSSDGRSAADSVQSVQISTETVRLSVALMTAPTRGPLTSSNTSVSNGTISNVPVVSFFPAINVPDSKSLISIAQSAQGGGVALISVVEYDASLWLAASSAKSTSSIDNSSSPLSGGTNAGKGLLEPTLVSDIVSIQVTYVGGSNGSHTVIPSFVASLEVKDAPPLVTTVFQHNCSVGMMQSRMYVCHESGVIMNLTCSGAAAAVIRRSCPVPQRVCNVLSMKDFSVASKDYCRVSPSASSDTSIVCECGLAQQGSNASSLQSLLSGGTGLNVAVMTQFVAGDFSGTITSTTKLSSDFAEQSISVIATFGCLWMMGMVAMSMHFFAGGAAAEADRKRRLSQWDHNQQRRMRKITIKQENDVGGLVRTKSFKVGPATVEKDPLSTRTDMFERMKAFLIAVLPTVYYPLPWIQRLWLQMYQHHQYLSLISAFITLFRRSDKLGVGSIQDERHQRKSILQVAYLLTAITTACFVLAVLFDFQYVSDDGTCEYHSSKISCLERTTLLDSSRHYCRWEENAIPSPGVLVELREGKVLQVIPLETVLVESSQPPCVFDPSPPSGYVMLVAITITTMVAWPVRQLLVFLFRILDAKKISDARIQLLARKAALLISGSEATDIDRNKTSKPVEAVGYSPQNRRRAVYGGPSRSVAPTETEIMHGVVPGAESEKGTEGVGVSGKELCEKCRKALTVLEMHEQAPTAPSVVLFARSEWLLRIEDMLEFASTHHRNRSSYSLVSDAAQNRVNGPFAFDESTNLVMSSVEKQIVVQRERLRYATDIEFGMCLIQVLYGDLLQQWESRKNIIHGVDSSSVTERLHQEKLFRGVLDANFVIEPSSSEVLQYIIIALLFVTNVGSLYFVLLRGIDRGYAWQSNLLRVCLLQWMIELLLHETMQVYVVCFLVPNVLFEEVQLRLVILLMSTMRWLDSVTLNVDVNEDGEKSSELAPRLNFASYSIATSKPELIESQIVKYLLDDEGRLVYKRMEWSSSSLSTFKWGDSMLYKLSKHPLWVQSLAAYACSLALYVSFHSVWNVLKPYTWSIGVMVVLVLVTVTIIMGCFVWAHQSANWYYVSILSPRLSYASISERLSGIYNECRQQNQIEPYLAVDQVDTNDDNNSESIDIDEFSSIDSDDSLVSKENGTELDIVIQRLEENAEQKQISVVSVVHSRDGDGDGADSVDYESVDFSLIPLEILDDSDLSFQLSSDDTESSSVDGSFE